MSDAKITDLFVIGGGINGCGIARDAAGRGMSVSLAEMKDLAWATSSASTKLFHGGLRYLEYGEIRLVREALIERETLLKAMPHISWPMRFVLPYHKVMRFEGSTPVSKLLSTVMPWMKGRRPAWMIRFGLFLYDNLGGRDILPGTKTLFLKRAKEGEPLEDRFEQAFEYSDCWIEDSRLVVLNARDAEARGAEIMTRTKVVSAEVVDGIWVITLERGGETFERRAKMLVNAGGPWVGDLIHNTVRINATEGVRLVKGSHIVTKKLFEHEKCYFFQGEDGRIIFAIPYETDFTLIGTTDAEHSEPDVQPECSDEERDYLLAFANQYFKQDITVDDIVWKYSGVRPLYDDGAKSATAATRDYVLKVNRQAGAPMLNVFGGKITTYRKLAEHALDKICPELGAKNDPWTAGVAMPGGNFKVSQVDALIAALKRDYAFLDDFWARRLIRAYGTEARAVLGGAENAEDLGQAFGATLTAREITWLMQNEYACAAEDVVWRRTKLGLRMSGDQIKVLEDWMAREGGTA
ncbi:MAG: glycerol-3-phosphate dehydrogenase [Pseudomonadota bacterium]